MLILFLDTGDWSPEPAKASKYCAILWQWDSKWIQLCMILDIANVVPIFNISFTCEYDWEMQVDDKFYIYLEYVYPGSINKYIRERCGAITEAVVRNFTRHILSGLAYLHGRKTIHRYYWTYSWGFTLWKNIKLTFLLDCLHVFYESFMYYFITQFFVVFEKHNLGILLCYLSQFLVPNTQQFVLSGWYRERSRDHLLMGGGNKGVKGVVALSGH